MRRATECVLLAAATIGGFVAQAQADVTAEQVREAIDRAVEYLKRQQKPDGSFSQPQPGYPGGVTALCTLALLNAGVEPEEKHVRLALDYLEKIRPQRTYVVSLQTMVFAKAGPDRDRYRSPVRPVGSNLSTTRCNAPDGGTLLDMCGMNGVIERGADTVRVEAGALDCDVARALLRKGLQCFCLAFC